MAAAARELFRLVDRCGRTVVLTEAQWIDHVLPRHPELLGHETMLEAVLRDPLFVNHDATRGSRETFYAPSPLPPPYGRAYVKVVVEFSTASSGQVKTAFFANHPRPGEQRKWSRPARLP